MGDAASVRAEPSAAEKLGQRATAVRTLGQQRADKRLNDAAGEDGREQARDDQIAARRRGGARRERRRDATRHADQKGRCDGHGLIFRAVLGGCARRRLVAGSLLVAGAPREAPCLAPDDPNIKLATSACAPARCEGESSSKTESAKSSRGAPSGTPFLIFSYNAALALLQSDDIMFMTRRVQLYLLRWRTGSYTQITLSVLLIRLYKQRIACFARNTVVHTVGLYTDADDASWVAPPTAQIRRRLAAAPWR